MTNYRYHKMYTWTWKCGLLPLEIELNAVMKSFSRKEYYIITDQIVDYQNKRHKTDIFNGNHMLLSPNASLIFFTVR
jgi:hypothetical protein